MVRKSDTPAQISNKIDEALRAGMSRKMDELVKKLDPLIKARQKTMFRVLAQKIIGASAPPDLGEYTPEWQPLTQAYKNYRLKRRGVARNRFYEFRSRRSDDGKTSLKELLNSAKVETVFGPPLVYKSKTATRGALRNSITVEPFPKVQESLLESDINEPTYFKGRNRGISWRLRNFQGSRMRPIMREFMLWWMNVELRNLIRSNIQ